MEVDRCIILDPKFHRLVSEVLQKVQFLEQNIFAEVIVGLFGTPKISKEYDFDVFGGNSSLQCPIADRVDL